tara:strand:+ start:10459 stop:10884 length:426 start_codon:yes stop_codon:yes gene_type:complete
MAQRGVNKVILVGNVGNEPEIRYTSSGQAVANLSLATSEVWKDKTTGDKQERTEWHRIVSFGKSAEIVRDYIKKGSKLFVEGSLKTRKWEDKNGVERYTTEVVSNEIQMLDSRGDQNSAPSPAQGMAEIPSEELVDEDIPF